MMNLGNFHQVFLLTLVIITTCKGSRLRRAVLRINTPRQGLQDITLTTPDAGPQFQNCVNAPVEISATLLPQALRQPRTNFNGRIFDDRMREMGSMPGDDKGHIIASSLGGPAELWNLFPQAVRSNRGPQNEDTGDNDERGGRLPPRRNWNGVEADIRNFLSRGGRRHVRYTVRFGYPDMRNPCRPYDISMTVFFYVNGVYQSSQTSAYINDNNDYRRLGQSA